MREKKLEDLFDELHKLQATTLLDALKSGDVSPQLHNAINKFLSDNNVTGIKAENTALKKLSDGLEAYDSGENVSKLFP